MFESFWSLNEQLMWHKDQSRAQLRMSSVAVQTRLELPCNPALGSSLCHSLARSGGGRGSVPEQRPFGVDESPTCSGVLRVKCASVPAARCLLGADSCGFLSTSCGPALGQVLSV